MMIRMLLEGMLTDLGHTVAGEAGSDRRGRDAGQAGRIRRRPARRQSQRPADHAGGRGSDRARSAVRLRQRLRPARRAGSLSRTAPRCRSRFRSTRWRRRIEAAAPAAPVKSSGLNPFSKELGELASSSARRSCRCLSGVTAMQCSSSAARSVPSLGLERRSGGHRRSSNKDCRGRPCACRYAAAPAAGGPAPSPRCL